MFLLIIWQENLILFSIFIKLSFWLVTKRLHCSSLNIRLYESGILCSVQFSSVAELCPILCDPMDCSMQASLSITNIQSSLKLMSIESVLPSNHLILCRPLLLLPSLFPNIRVFSFFFFLNLSQINDIYYLGISYWSYCCSFTFQWSSVFLPPPTVWLHSAFLNC